MRRVTGQKVTRRAVTALCMRFHVIHPKREIPHALFAAFLKGGR